MTKININKDKVWFTSDLHFFHENIIHYTNRPWSNAQEMNEGLIGRWNGAIGPDNDIFILGDLAMGGNSKAPLLAKILRRLNGRKYLIPGNHDTYILRSEECLNEITVLPPLFEVRVPDPDALKKRQKIVLCHYAMKIWNGSHKGTWHLYGHSHHSMPPDYDRKAFDIGVDGKGYDYRPQSYAEVKNLMSMFGNTPIDHHNKRTG